MTKIDGGAAFPRAIGHDGSTDYQDREVNSAQDGMTLRDYFAGQALAGIVAAGWPHGGPAEDIAAEAAYRFADALLAARAK